MRDSIEFEWEGIPAVAVVHAAMTGSAQAMALVSGLAEQRFLTVDYPHIPLAIWTDDEIAEVVSELAPKIIELLTDAVTRPDAASESAGSFDEVVAGLQAIARADGGDMVLVAHTDGDVSLRLVVENAHCVECIMPRPFLEQLALARFTDAGVPVSTVRIDDPREHPDFVMPE